MFRVADLPNLFFCTALTLTAVYLLVRFGNGRPARQLRRAGVPVALLAALALLASCEDRKAPPRKSVAEAPAIQRPFEKFQKKLQFDWDDEYF